MEDALLSNCIRVKNFFHTHQFAGQLTIVVHSFVVLAANVDAGQPVLEVASLIRIIVVAPKWIFESGVAVAGQPDLLPRFEVEFLDVVLRHVRCRI